MPTSTCGTFSSVQFEAGCTDEGNAMSDGIYLSNHADKSWKDPTDFACGDSEFYDLVTAEEGHLEHIISAIDGVYEVRAVDFVNLRIRMNQCPEIQDTHYETVDLLEANPTMWLGWSY